MLTLTQVPQTCLLLVHPLHSPASRQCMQGCILACSSKDSALDAISLCLPANMLSACAAAQTPAGALEAAGSSQPAAGDTTQQPRGCTTVGQPDAASEQGQAHSAHPAVQAAGSSQPVAGVSLQQSRACTVLGQPDPASEQGHAHSAHPAAEAPSDGAQRPPCGPATSDAADGAPGSSTASQQAGVIPLQRKLAQPDASPEHGRACSSHTAAQPAGGGVQSPACIPSTADAAEVVPNSPVASQQPSTTLLQGELTQPNTSFEQAWEAAEGVPNSPVVSQHPSRTSLQHKPTSGTAGQPAEVRGAHADWLTLQFRIDVEVERYLQAT